MSPTPAELKFRQGVIARHQIANYLRSSVPTMSGFSLVYQPQADQFGRIVGAEALLRWDPGCGHNITPDQFVPVLESYGMIATVGRWVVEEALCQLVEFRARGIALRRMSINVSAPELTRRGFAPHLMSTVDALGLQPSDVGLELTEGQAIKDSEAVAKTVRALHDGGYEWEIDDFGMGYASIRWLRKHKFTGIKLDRSLVNATDEPPGLIPGVVCLAHALEMTVVAEGIETVERREAMLMVGVDLVQGYLIGRPMPAEQWGLALDT